MKILPIGEIEPEILDMLSKRLAFLPFEISILDEVLVPKKAFNSSRNQYESSYFLDLARKYPSTKVLGIADVDLYSEPLNFVFGQAEVSGKACVISLYRLKGEKERYENRAVKEAVHELGHTFGLKDCSDESCVMHFSNCLEDTDLKKEMYCEKCQGKLKRMGLF